MFDFIKKFRGAYFPPNTSGKSALRQELQSNPKTNLIFLDYVVLAFREEETLEKVSRELLVKTLDSTIMDLTCTKCDEGYHWLRIDSSYSSVVVDKEVVDKALCVFEGNVRVSATDMSLDLKVPVDLKGVRHANQNS